MNEKYLYKNNLIYFQKQNIKKNLKRCSFVLFSFSFSFLFSSYIKGGALGKYNPDRTLVPLLFFTLPLLSLHAGKKRMKWGLF